MFGIRRDIIASCMLHSLMLAAAVLAGSSSELSGRRAVMVSLIEDLGGIGGSSPDRHAELPVRQAAQPPQSAPAAREKAVVRNPSPVRREMTAPALAPAVQPETGGADLPESVAPTMRPASGTGGSDSAGISSGGQTGNRQGSLQGNGSGGASGTGGVAGSSGGASLRSLIRSALQAHLVYPYIARKRRMQGSVLVSFRINLQGGAEAVRVLKGSGYSILDTAALETVARAAPFPASNSSIEVPITFELKDQ